MSSTRKTSKVRTSKLSSRQSPHGAAVTLFDVSSSSIETLPTSSRRSNRTHSIISAQNQILKEEETTKLEPDMEDIVGPSTSTKVTSISQKRKGIDTPNTSPKKSKAIRLELDFPHPAPESWEETYAAIKEMRKDGGAPVDSMGCHMAGGPVSDPKTKRFITLISLMLSSQTKDEVTHNAVLNLRSSLGELTVENVLSAEESVIATAIAKVGFWRRKTEYIRKAAQKIQDEFCGEIPNTLEGLCSLTGVGPKMAFLALQVAWNINVGIGVDVHVHRITNRLGWHKPPTKEPEQTRLNLQSWLPTNLHGEINPLLVGFGQTICLPVGPRCDICTLSAKGLCPSAKTGIKSKVRKTDAKGNASVKIKVETQTVSNTEITPGQYTKQEVTVKLEERSIDNGVQDGQDAKPEKN